MDKPAWIVRYEEQHLRTTGEAAEIVKVDKPCKMSLQGSHIQIDFPFYYVLLIGDEVKGKFQKDHIDRMTAVLSVRPTKNEQ